MTLNMFGKLIINHKSLKNSNHLCSKMANLILGIDDSGRGPVIGPMVLAGCLIDPKIETELRKLGVRDSKQLTPKRREFLEQIIKERATAFSVEVIFPEDIDNKGKSGINLNTVEAEMASKIINKINKGYGKIKVVIDCPSVNRTAWRDTVRTDIDNLTNLEILCEHKADRNHISVSAASIIAKQERERQMSLLKKKYGDSIGSGYASDPNTTKFLSEKGQKYKDSGIFRKSWKTWQDAEAKAKQTKLKF